MSIKVNLADLIMRVKWESDFAQSEKFTFK